MIIEFSVENYRSFKERIVLSMIAAKLRAPDTRLDRDNVIIVNEKLSLLRSAVIYGANASGKSNVVKAMSFMRFFVMHSMSLADDAEIPIEPFCFKKSSSEEPSVFEVVFLLDHAHQFKPKRRGSKVS